MIYGPVQEAIGASIFFGLCLSIIWAYGGRGRWKGVLNALGASAGMSVYVVMFTAITLLLALLNGERNLLRLLLDACLVLAFIAAATSIRWRSKQTARPHSEQDLAGPPEKPE